MRSGDHASRAPGGGVDAPEVAFATRRAAVEAWFAPRAVATTDSDAWESGDCEGGFEKASAVERQAHGESLDWVGFYQVAARPFDVLDHPPQVRVTLLRCFQELPELGDEARVLATGTFPPNFGEGAVTAARWGDVDACETGEVALQGFEGVSYSEDGAP